MKKIRLTYDMQPEDAYIGGLKDAMDLVHEQREEEGGEACCAFSEVVALDNAKYLIDQHRLAVEMGKFDEHGDACD